jgi:hypothetical protein
MLRSVFSPLETLSSSFEKERLRRAQASSSPFEKGGLRGIRSKALSHQLNVVLVT